MSKLKELEKELEEHWKRTERERKVTHSCILYEKFLKKNPSKFLVKIKL